MANWPSVIEWTVSNLSETEVAWYRDGAHIFISASTSSNTISPSFFLVPQPLGWQWASTNSAKQNYKKIGETEEIR